MFKSDFSISGVELFRDNIAVDERGSFQRLANLAEKVENFKVEQMSLSTNKSSDTLRGLHFQSAEFAENKLVTCLSGAIYDVVVDLRTNSETYLKWYGQILGPDQDFRSIFIPKGCAHGFYTLVDDSNVLYLMDEKYNARSAMGLRWNDPKLAINWPGVPKIMSERDRCFTLLENE